MNRKYNNKLIIGLAVPICLSIGSVYFNYSKLNLDSNVVYAQDQQSTGLKIYEPEIGASDSLEFTVEAQDTSDTIFNLELLKSTEPILKQIGTANPIINLLLYFLFIMFLH